MLGLFKREKKLPVCSAVIVAAGSSQRMGSDKLMAPLGDINVLGLTLTAFENSPLVSEIVVVTREDRLQEIADLCKKYGIKKTSKVVCGGATRAQSALAGVSAVNSKAKLIAIHDGARPFVSKDLIERTVCAADVYMAAAPGLKSVDTLKTVDENGFICNTVNRDTVIRIQTPQIFHADLIKGALTKAVTDNLPITDDCSAIEMMGVKTFVVDGDERNIKLTTPSDMILAAAIYDEIGG